jgi:hypothetical protein
LDAPRDEPALAHLQREPNRTLRPVRRLGLWCHVVDIDNAIKAIDNGTKVFFIQKPWGSARSKTNNMP